MAQAVRKIFGVITLLFLALSGRAIAQSGTVAIPGLWSTIHFGTSFPTTARKGQFFYKTTGDTLGVWSGTAWIKQKMGIGSSGAPVDSTEWKDLGSFLRPADLGDNSIHILSADGTDSLTTTIDNNGVVTNATTSQHIFSGGQFDIGTNSSGQNAKINATLGVEMAPALEAVNWTCQTDGTGGWSAGSGTLVKTVSAGSLTATPSGTFTVVAGRVYKVVIVTSAASSLNYTIGGTSGSVISSAMTTTDYVLAATNAKIIFSGTLSATATITSLSVKELTLNTGGFVAEQDVLIGGSLGVGAEPNTTNKLEIRGSVNIPQGSFYKLNNSRAVAQISGNYHFGRMNADTPTDGAWMRVGTDDIIRFFTDNAQRATFLSSSGNFGVATTAPDKITEINLGTTDALRLTYNDNNGSAVNYTDLGVTSGGDMTIMPSGGDVSVTGSLAITKKFNIGDTTGVVLAAAGTATVTASNQVLDTFGGAALDTLTTLTGTIGDIVVLRTRNSGRDIFIADGANFKLDANATLSDPEDSLTLLALTSTVWKKIGGSDNN